MSIFCRHGDGRLDFGQTTSTSSGQYRRGRGLLVRELANDQEIMVAEGQVPPDELAAYALEEFRNGLLIMRDVTSRFNEMRALKRKLAELSSDPSP